MFGIMSLNCDLSKIHSKISDLQDNPKEAWGGAVSEYGES
jgi:hypothetical protein